MFLRDPFDLTLKKLPYSLYAFVELTPRPAPEPKGRQLSFEQLVVWAQGPGCFSRYGTLVERLAATSTDEERQLLRRYAFSPAIFEGAPTPSNELSTFVSQVLVPKVYGVKPGPAIKGLGSAKLAAKGAPRLIATELLHRPILAVLRVLDDAVGVTRALAYAEVLNFLDGRLPCGASPLST